MPEPLLAETITDIDGIDAGELEIDAVGARRATRGRRYWQTSLEAEWRVTRHLGLAVEGDVATPEKSGMNATGDVRIGASWSLLHDLMRDAHVQLETTARVADHVPLLTTDPSEPALPVAFGLRWAVRRGRWTMRAGLGAEAGAPSAHALPLRESLAAIFVLGADQRLGFVGIELLGDWGYEDPLTLAPNILINGSRFDIPLRLGVALPWTPSMKSGGPTYGAFLRLIFEVD